MTNTPAKGRPPVPKPDFLPAGFVKLTGDQGVSIQGVVAQTRSVDEQKAKAADQGDAPKKPVSLPVRKAEAHVYGRPGTAIDATLLNKEFVAVVVVPKSDADAQVLLSYLGAQTVADDAEFTVGVAAKNVKQADVDQFKQSLKLEK